MLWWGQRSRTSHSSLSAAARPAIMRAVASDDELMQQALAAADSARLLTAPNPWVGAAIETPAGSFHSGRRKPPGGAHAEIVALRSAGGAAQGSTLATTLEPCSHVGRTAACVDAIIDAGVARVIVGVVDPDQQVDGTGLDRLRAAGIDVDRRRARRRSRRSARPLPAPSAYRPPVRGGEARVDRRWPHRRARCYEQVDHRRRGTHRRPPPARREPGHPRRVGHGPLRRPGAHDPPGRRSEPASRGPRFGPARRQGAPVPGMAGRDRASCSTSSAKKVSSS